MGTRGRKVEEFLQVGEDEFICTLSVVINGQKHIEAGYIWRRTDKPNSSYNVYAIRAGHIEKIGTVKSLDSIKE